LLLRLRRMLQRDQLASAAKQADPLDPSATLMMDCG
jgi:hypothetical protein